MTHDYEALRAENERRYGTDIGRIGKRLLEDRYDKRTHFIFELLQNAEDALRRRTYWNGQRSVRFLLSQDKLQVAHFGAPFDANDVIGICGIDQSTKDLTAIGRFGIGFKSVYAFTSRPEVHSGDEHFAIESYVWPCLAPEIERDTEETVFVVPFKEDDPAAASDIADGLRSLGPRTLLFLRAVEELAWELGKEKGLYLRSSADEVGPGVRKVTILGEESGRATTEETWLIFDQAVQHEGKPVGFAELAFKVVEDADTLRVEPVTPASLVAFFPTVLSTHTGFLVQGPYRTTPSRDNVPVDDPWNRELVATTAELLKRSLIWMRDAHVLDVSAIRALPLTRDALEDHLFEPLFDAVLDAFETEALIPTSTGGYASAPQTALARTQDLRDLLDPDQLARLLQSKKPVHWVSGDVTADRAAEIRRFFNWELEITEHTAETLLPKMSKTFLESQPDKWVILLYKTLSSIPRLIQRARTDFPVIRLEDGNHVVAVAHGKAQAFLPGPTETAFPTVRRSLCKTKEALEFLKLLRLTEPDPVDDVILNVLPRYQNSLKKIDGYEADIDRIRRAAKTDSNAQRDKLIGALREAHFVMAVDAKTREAQTRKPSQVYLATDRLSKLFDGISGVYIVDGRLDCLRGEDMRELLEACLATRYIAPVAVGSRWTMAERRKLRREAGCESCTAEGSSEDYALRGLDELLAQLPAMPFDQAANRARLLWEALAELLERRRQAVFTATYRWTYYHGRSASDDAYFVRILNRKAWVPTAAGKLAAPSEVDFQSLGWRANPVLEARIHFKPPVVELLAREVGIEPAVLSLLKQLGVTDLATLQKRLQIADDEVADDEVADDEVADDEVADDEVADDEVADDEVADDEVADDEVADDETDNGEPDTAMPPPGGAPISDDDADEYDGEEKLETIARGGHSKPSQRSNSDDHGNAREEPSAKAGAGHSDTGDYQDSDRKGPSSERKPKAKEANGQFEFISYVATKPGDHLSDPDGLTSQARNALEEDAISLILEKEPSLERTPAGNKGFDLVETDAAGEPERWVEVKAMAATLQQRPVGLSAAQFEFARRTGEQYWLYIVENAANRDDARIVKIQNPAGRAGYFTYDRGWVDAADTVSFGSQEGTN